MSYPEIGRKIWNDVRWLKSVVNVEKKYNTVAASTTSSTTAAFVLLNGIAPGDAGTSRDGQSIKMSSILLRYILSIHATPTTTFHRVILFVDSQANGVVPAIADILQATTSVISPLVIGNANRFTILRDINVTLSQSGPAAATIKVFKKLDLHTKYNTGTAGTVADINTNSLYFLHMSDQATDVPTFAYTARLRWIDN